MTPASASALRATANPWGIVWLVIAGMVRATLRSTAGRRGGTVTCSALRSTRRSHRAVFGSSTVKDWLRRNETRGWIQVRSNAPGLATPKNRRIFSTWVPCRRRRR